MSGRFRFIHAADLHLDTPFQGVAGPAPEVATALYEASLQAWDNVVDLAIEREAAFVLIAGDIYDGAERGVRAQLRFLSGLRRLDTAGIQAFVVFGNHDPLDGWSAIRELPSNVVEFGPEEVASHTFAVEGTSVCVHGISYATQDTQENLARRFKADPAAALNIGLLHTMVGSIAEHLSYAPCTLTDLDAAHMDYWALGHVHKQMFLREGGPWVAYSGDTQGRSPKPSETGPKGVLVAEVAGSVIESVGFETVDVVRFLHCQVDIQDAVDVGWLESRIVELVDERRRAGDGRSLLVRVVLEGRGAIAADLHREGTVPELVTRLRDVYSGREPFVWIESLKDRSRGLLDLDELRKGDGFRSVLLRYSDALVADPGQAEKLLRDACDKLNRPVPVARALRDLEDEDPAGLLSEARDLALDELEREEAR